MPGDIFEFSRRERVGIACLLSLIVLLQFLPSAWHLVFYQPPFSDTTGFHRTAREVAALMEAEREAASRRYAKGSYRDSGKHYEKRSYRDDGKYDRKFYKGDEKKFYRNGGPRYGKGFYRDSGKYANTYPFTRTPVPVLDINAADSAQWERLPGIGPSLAKRIVGFRERLGGFYSISQVGEVYGLADSVFKKIQPFLRHSDVSLRKISLNETDEKSLAQHPYINTNLARMLVRYRSAHGPFRDVGAIRGLPLVDDSIYRKIEKYLTVN